ncbi:hypothetical protein M9H77_07705 [Catharanthus roseus]|uniref:Uncharacterized protein n=1 Tax=Catharanthus roseus TaxID=4058 RepID=A0ACC0BVW1_CATRO|nr:hypothetical protein M9H77_07705 [Catharanthus roseus]
MSKRSIEKEKCIAINEKDRGEKERLDEGLSGLDSTPTLTKESEKDECTKEKEHELEQSDSIKENECYIEKQESIEEEQKEKEVVTLRVRDSSCVQKFLLQNMENEGSLDYKIDKTISFFTPISYLCFEHFLKETKWYPFALNFDRVLLNILAL